MIVHLLLSVYLGCSLGQLNTTPCTSNDECQSVFGWARVCEEETGFCEEAEMEERCTQTWPEDLWQNLDAYQDHILLGVDYELESYALEVASMRLAVQQVNNTGGLKGREFALIECENAGDASSDGLSQDAASDAITRWLADDVGVPAIIGPGTSGRTETAFEIAEPHGTMLISPSATSPALTALDGLVSTDNDPGLLWRTVAPDTLQAMVIAADMEAREIDNIAIIYQTGAYGDGIQEGFCDAYGGDCLDGNLFKFTNSAQISDHVTDIANADFDEVLFVSSEEEDAVEFLLSAGNTAGMNNIGIFLTDAAAYEGVFAAAEEASHLFPIIRGTRPTIDETSSVYISFYESFELETGMQPTDAFAAHSFDAAWLVIYGTAWAMYQEGEVSGLGIARGLRQVSRDTEVNIRPSSWSTVKAHFQDGLSIDVIGASGALDYDTETGETATPIEIWLVEEEEDGSWTFVQDSVTNP